MSVKILLVVMAAMFCLVAHAEDQLMSDKGSAKLAASLAGHALVCGPMDNAAPKSEETGFFPLTVRATDKGAGKTLLSVETKDPKIGFGFGGTEFDSTEYSGSWFILSNGDDGRRYLFVQTFSAKDINDLKCSANNGDSVDGDIAGVVTEIWDAGNISSHGVQCCLQ